MKMVIIHGQSYKGSAYHIARELRDARHWTEQGRIEKNDLGNHKKNWNLRRRYNARKYTISIDYDRIARTIFI